MMLNFSLNWFDYLSLFLIIFVGIPHGALDGAISVTLGYSKRFILQLGFFVTYLSISAFVIIMWYFFPVESLIFFLFISIFHFGCGDLDWENNKTYLINGYFQGGLVILGIIFFNRMEVNYFFSVLSGEQLSLLWKCLYLGMLFWLSALIFIICNLKKMKFSRYYTFLILFICLVITTLPPLPAFAIYFCFIHSFHHIKRVVPKLLNFMERRKAISLMITLSVMSWLGGGLALYYILNLDIFPNAILKVTFIGLAALTFPHMILVDGFFRSKYKI
ncbi:Brp/Blh family beta-carotene 15,15'-dioxygenase [Alphaproteobacteria bacterium]|nr:Brp/Blh family beta-carotene 15,15'-dioxygenase [Alphaproteobacteria bacterium]